MLFFFLEKNGVGESTPFSADFNVNLTKLFSLLRFYFSGT